MLWKSQQIHRLMVFQEGSCQIMIALHDSTCDLVASATQYNALQHTATHCNTLQRTATHCNALQRILSFKRRHSRACYEASRQILRRISARDLITTYIYIYITLQRTAPHCNAFCLLIGFMPDFVVVISDTLLTPKKCFLLCI